MNSANQFVRNINIKNFQSKLLDKYNFSKVISIVLPFVVSGFVFSIKLSLLIRNVSRGKIFKSNNGESIR